MQLPDQRSRVAQHFIAVSAHIIFTGHVNVTRNFSPTAHYFRHIPMAAKLLASVTGISKPAAGAKEGRTLPRRPSPLESPAYAQHATNIAAVAVARFIFHT